MTQIPQASPAPFRGFSRSLLSAWQGRVEHRRRRRMRIALAELNDHFRRDMGIPEFCSADHAIRLTRLYPQGW